MKCRDSILGVVGCRLCSCLSRHRVLQHFLWLFGVYQTLLYVHLQAFGKYFCNVVKLEKSLVSCNDTTKYRRESEANLYAIEETRRNHFHASDAVELTSSLSHLKWCSAFSMALDDHFHHLLVCRVLGDREHTIFQVADEPAFVPRTAALLVVSTAGWSVSRRVSCHRNKLQETCKSDLTDVEFWPSLQPRGVKKGGWVGGGEGMLCWF